VVTLIESKEVMKIQSGLFTAVCILLYWRAGYISVTAKNTTIPLLGFKHCFAIFTFVEKKASI